MFCSEGICLTGDDIEAKGVKSLDGDPIQDLRVVKNLAQTLGHFLGSLICKGNSKYLFGPGAPLFKQIGNAMRKCEGFAGPGTGNNQERPPSMSHRFLLGRVQIIGQMNLPDGLRIADCGLRNEILFG